LDTPNERQKRSIGEAGEIRGRLIFLSLSLGDIDLAKEEEILNQAYEYKSRRQRVKQRGGFSGLTLNSTVQAKDGRKSRPDCLCYRSLNERQA